VNWRDLVLREIQPGVSDLILVADPDGLLAEEYVLSTLGSMGFDILFLDDPITFRYAYESKYRTRWDCGETAPLVVVVQGDRQELRRLPFDAWEKGRKAFLSLADVFPKLSYPVVASLEKSWMDKLYKCYEGYDGPPLGERATKEFILEHVFGIVLDLIDSPISLMKILLSRHCSSIVLPKVLDDHIVNSLRAKAVFRPWPLEDIVPSREGFLAFMQREWELYVARGDTENKSTMIPFDHYDIRVYVSNLFLEGILRPVPVSSVEGLPTWALPGVLFNRQDEDIRRMTWLLEEIVRGLDGETVSHRDWQRMAALWAELLVLRFELDVDSETRSRIDQLHDELENRFAYWMLVRYGSLANLPYTVRPTMVHHVSRYLAHQRGKGEVKKIALLVIDGLALDQWLVIRNVIREKYPKWRVDENQVFAWVPTITSVSRQSLFAAELPMYSGDTITSTSKEERLWRRFWEDSGVRANRIYYGKSLGDEQIRELFDILEHQFDVVGLVIDKVDRIMHGTELGSAGMHQQVRLWAKQSWIAQLIDLLLENEYAVYLTSDHGNIASRGVGRLDDGILAETRGERVRIYDSEVLRKQMMEKAAGAVSWPGFGLPNGYYALLAPGRTAFVKEGQEVVSHGGIALEEVVVPFARIREEP
jgi:hypothetical protein